jgi:nicotinamidase-related amidase
MATAFIGLDFINDIVHPEGKISHTADLAAERGIIEKVNRALATAREKGWLTILVKVGFAKGYTDQPKHSPFFGRLHEIGALEAQSSGMDFHPELKAELAESTQVNYLRGRSLRWKILGTLAKIAATFSMARNRRVIDRPTAANSRVCIVGLSDR